MGLNIDFKLLPMKAHYFLYNGGTGSVVPFMPVYARQLGFSTFVVGSIYSILPILGLVAKPLFGALADKYQRHKSMFLAFILLTIVSFASIKFITPIPKTAQLDFHCNDGISDLRYCPETMDYCGAERLKNDTSATGAGIEFALKCEMKEDWMWKFVCDEWHTNNATACSRDEHNVLTLTAYVRNNHVELIKKCLLFEIQYATYADKLTKYNNESAMRVTCPKSALNGRYFNLSCRAQANRTDVMDVIAENGIHDDRILSISQFWHLFLALAISWIGMAVVVSVGDAICFDLLGKRHELYGRQRLWGAIGWGVFSIIAGTLVDAMSESQFVNYSVIYFLLGAALLPDMLVSSCLEFKPNAMSSNIIKDVCKLFKSLRICVFFIWCIAIGFCTALVWNFLFWYLEDLADQKSDCDHQQRMKTLQGIALGVQSFGGELPFFFIAGWVINKMGHINAMTMVLFAFGIRLCLYSALSNPWWVLPIELMQGMTFALFYATMATYANIVAPHGTAATLQGLVGAIFEGIGVSAGSFLGGYLMKAIGGSETFLIFGIGAIVLSVVHFIVQYLLEKYSTEPDYLTTAEYTSPNDEMQIFEEDDYD